MSIYSYFWEYRGKVYLSQNRSPDLVSSKYQWAFNIDIKDIYGFGEKSKNELLSDIEEIEFDKVGDLVNSWCMSFLIRNSLSLVDIVKTVDSPFKINQKELFTFYLFWDGGTFLKQYYSTSKEEAYKLFLKETEIKEIEELRSHLKSVNKKTLSFQDYVNVSVLRDVFVDKDFILFCILTDKEKEPFID